MNVMVLSVAAQLRQPGIPSESRLTADFEPIEFCGVRMVFERPVEVEATFEFDGEAFMVRGSIDAYIRSECSRCLEEYVQHLELSFDERYCLEPDEESYGFKGDSIDLAPMVTDCILLGVSPYGVCREECKGLCPQCGCNLNYERCSCVSADE